MHAGKRDLSQRFFRTGNVIVQHPGCIKNQVNIPTPSNLDCGCLDARFVFKIKGRIGGPGQADNVCASWIVLQRLQNSSADGPG